MRKRKSKYIKALAVVLSMMTIMAGLPIPATVGYSIGEEVVETASEQPEEITDSEASTKETEIDESEEVLPDEETEIEQPQDESPQKESPADAEGQAEIAPEASTESVSPDESASAEVPENASSGEQLLEELPVQDDSVLIEESEEVEESAESTEEQLNEEVTEPVLPDELPVEEDVLPETDSGEEEPEESELEEPVAYEHPVKTALSASGYAYLMTEQEVHAFANPDMQEVIFTISPNGILLVTAFIEHENNILEVQFMTASGETITGYVFADDLSDNLLTSGDIDAAALVTNFNLVFVGDGTVAAFEVAGETNIPIITEIPTEMEQPAESPVEETSSEQPVETSAEDDPLEQPEEPQSDETELLPAENENMTDVPESEVEEAPMMFAAAPMMYASYPYGFSLRDHYGYTGYFYAGQTNVYGSSGDDSYPQLAASDEEGTIYATPHYLDGVVVYCLEHKYPGPGERISDDELEPAGPYTIVDLAGYKTTPGYSEDIFSDRTMHAIAWIIRHSYPFVVMDNYESENENWSRAAGQFAIRQVIKEMEGSEYVRSYWDLDDFYVRADSAPEEYLEYARWLAANAIDYAENAGTINVSNKSVSYSNGICVGTVTVTTDAGQMRVSRSVGSMTGNSGGQDGSYYYLYSGDTITVSAAGTGFTMEIEVMSSSDDEAYFLVGVSDERIQKVIIPQEGEPYPLASTSVSFEVPHGSVSVVKKDADSGAALSGAVFELLSGSSVLQTVTTGSNGTATFSNTLIATGATDENGLLTFSGCYPHGQYYVRELYSPEGWKMGAERYPVSITPEGEVADAAIIRVEIPDAILNELLYTHVTLTKTDLTGANTLPGATIEVQDADGNVIFRDVTDENGEIADIPVTPGSYTFREVYAPEGYELSEAVFSFTVDENGNVTGDTVVRDDYTRFSILKHDEYGLPMEGVEFGLLDEAGIIIMHTLTDENGLATFEKVPYGTFHVIETKPLAGYVRSELNVEVTVDGTFINPAEPIATVVNRLNEVLLRKVDQDGH